MSQVTAYTISGSPLEMAQLATELENMFAAAASANRGGTAPSNPFDGMIWWDTSLDPVEHLQRYSTTAGWVSLLSINTTTGAITFQGADAADFAKLAAAGATLVDTDSAQTITGVKTLTSPVLNTGVSGTAILDEDAMTSDSATKLATQQSIKAYADTKADKASTSFSPGGDLTGTIYIARTDKHATMQWAGLTHSSDHLVASSTGIVPAAYRPVTTASALYYASGNTLYHVQVSAAGTITFQYFDYDGATTAKTSTQPGCVSWVIS